MNIALLVTQLEAGGAQTFAFELSAELRARGYCCENWFLYQKSEAYAGYEREVFLDRRPRGAREQLLMLRGLVTAIKRFRPDVLITFTHYANVVGQAVACLCGVRHRIASQQNPSFSYPVAARLADGLLGSLGCYTANVACAREVGNSFRRYPASYRRRLAVVLNAVKHRRLSGRISDARTRCGLPPDRPLILTVGRLAEQKNQDLLVRVVARLPQHHLAIVGIGDRRKDLVNCATDLGVQDRVHLVGQVERHELLDLIRSAEVFALPSVYEGRSLVLEEAIGCEAVIVASDIPAIREACMCAGQEAAVLVPPTDYVGWASAIERVTFDEAARRRLREACRALASNSGMSATVSGYERLWQVQR